MIYRTGAHVFQEDMSFRKICLMEGHVLLKDIPYRRTCLTGINVLWEDISYRRTCLMAGHVLWGGMSYMRTRILDRKCPVIQEDIVCNFLLVCLGLISMNAWQNFCVDLNVLLVP